MKVLIVGAGEDLRGELQKLGSACEAFLNHSPEGLEFVFADSPRDALASIPQRGQAPWPLAIADGPDSGAKAAELLKAFPSSKVLAAASEALPDGAAVLKRPLVPGELKSLLLMMLETFSARRDFDDLFNSSASMMALTDPCGKILELNKAASAVSGVEEDAARGRMIWDIFPFLANHKSSFERAMASKEQERLNRIVVESPGEDKHYDATIYPLSAGRGAAVRLDEVSDEVKKDEHLRQAQKMDSVGSLAAGLAHDFNNVIGGVEATMSSIKFSLDSANDVEDLKGSLSGDFELIEESVQRGKDIIAQLMALSRRKEMPLSPVDLNGMVENVLKICRNTLPRCVSVECAPYAGKAMVKAFPTQIEQVILNLCINASHAMTIMRKEGEEQGGTLSVSISPIEVGRNITSVIPEAAEGNYWLLSVSDTGIGMTREIMQKIFEPFFTTKEKGKGTGLGLAMVYNIVRQHKGFMDIFSEPGLGSTFLVFLPVLPE